MSGGASRPRSRSANNRVIVLDRDGTVVVDRHYLSDPGDLQFLPGAEAGLRKMSQLGFRLVIITNQSGVARGLFSLARLEEIHARLEEMLRSAGIRLERIYYCPHAPADGCDCRKPNLALMHRAAEDLQFDMSESIVIGDKPSDIEFGRRAGAVTMLIGHGTHAAPSRGPSHVVENLEAAADLIERELMDSS